MFVRTLAMEAKRDGIRVNALTPSIVADTLMHDRVMRRGLQRKLFAKAKTLAHLGVTLPADQAALVVFLAGAGAAAADGSGHQRQWRYLRRDPHAQLTRVKSTWTRGNRDISCQIDA